MGLSNEERLNKFYYGMQGMRQQDAGLLKILEEEKFKFGITETSKWLSKIDEIVGKHHSIFLLFGCLHWKNFKRKHLLNGRNLFDSHYFLNWQIQQIQTTMRRIAGLK